MVDGVVGAVFSVQNDLGDGDEGVAVLQQGFDNAGQGLWGVLGGIVEENDGTGLYFGDYPFCDFRGGKILPIQTVAT